MYLLLKIASCIRVVCIYKWGIGGQSVGVCSIELSFIACRVYRRGSEISHQCICRKIPSCIKGWEISRSLPVYSSLKIAACKWIRDESPSRRIIAHMYIHTHIWDQTSKSKKSASYLGLRHAIELSGAKCGI